MGNIKQELTSGIFYIAIAKYSGIAVQLAITAILARLLSPTDFGTVAVATVIISFFNILSDIGIGPAIIQNKDLTNDDLSHIFSLTLYTGIILSSLFFLCAQPIAHYYENNILIPVCRWLSLPILFYSLNIVPLNLQYKHKRFRFVAFTTLSVQIVTGTISMIGAYYGMGLYALVMSQVLSSILLFGIHYLHHTLRFHIWINLQSLKKIISFSFYQFSFNLVNYFSRNLDKLLIGRFIGMSSLGYYEKSYRLMQMPLQNITFVITPVMQPVFSSLQHDLSGLARKYIKVLQLLAYISFPLSALLYFTAEELILLFFGSQWHEAVGVFKILALTVSMQILTSTSGAIYQSANATKQLFVAGCWGSFFMITSFMITIFCWHSIEAVAYGFLAAQLANTIQCFFFLFRTLHYSVIEILMMLIRPFMVGAVLFLCLWIADSFLSTDKLMLSLCLKSAISVITTAFLIHLWGKYNLLRYIRKMLKI